MRPEIDNVLQSLSLNGYSVFTLINDILLSHDFDQEDPNIKPLRKGVERDATDICARLLSHNPSSASISIWALGVARSILSEVESITRKEHALTLPNNIIPSPGSSSATALTPTHGLETALNIGRVLSKKYSQSVTIDMLPDDVLLEIFGICLCDPTSLPLEQTKQWQRLVHVCRRWRQITFPSPRRLDLRLSCSYDSEIPVRVKKNLKFWPLTMPLTIDYPLRSLLPSPIDEVNIFVALKRSRRVHHIEVFASFTFLRKVVTIMRKSFPALTHLELGWDYKGIFEDVPVLPKGFLNKSAPCLQYLCLESFLFPEVPTFLLSSHNLVTLKLKKIFRNSFISPEAMVECLSGMTRLKTLSISFYCDDIDAFDQERTRPDLPTQIVLPSLIHFDYDGCSGYLENLVAQIDTPLLITLEITYHSDQIQNSHLSRFISHTENLKSYQFSSVQAWFWISEHEDNIVKLSCPQGKYPQASLSISLPRKVYLDLQLTNSFIGQLDMMFSNVNHLFLNGNSVHSSSIGDTDPEWLSFFRLFPAVKELRLSGGMGEEIVSVLEGTTEEMIPEILPALHVIWLDDENEDYEEEDYNEQMELGPMDLRQFHSLRQRSGHPVTIVDTQEEFEETLESHRSGQENVP